MPVRRWPGAPVDVSPLAQPLVLQPSGRVVKNRIMKAAMAEDLATWSAKNIQERGIPTKETIELYRRWGEGDSSFGIIVTGNIAIEYDMMNSVGENVITLADPPDNGVPRFEAFRALAAAAKHDGSLIIGEVAHPGGQLFARIRKDTIAPSAVQIPAREMYGSYAVPREATQADIDHVVASFAHAATYLAAAGFDGIALHGGHGYLLAQFLSQRHNKRTDAYGGPLTNRIRIVLEIATAIRRAVPKEFVTGGLRSAAAMVDALGTVDGVGLARPAAQEPRIARDVLEGRVSSAVRPVEGLEDLGRGFRLAGTQLAQVARGEEPFDASDEGMARAYLADFDKWYQALVDDGDKLEHRGYIQLSTPQRPYGQAY
ncbi:hypothetical protein PG991_002880 [Apiospora marii]|uniref:NADH:flavin oxidoreductase/NADH oxidase N-terminal domain-containing protein n=1 Tax=Apiospora marii TaxID=335849 RepID=A0ABR1SGM6_9PEZI